MENEENERKEWDPIPPEHGADPYFDPYYLPDPGLELPELYTVPDPEPEPAPEPTVNVRTPDPDPVTAPVAAPDPIAVTAPVQPPAPAATAPDPVPVTAPVQPPEPPAAPETKPAPQVLQRYDIDDGQQQLWSEPAYESAGSDNDVYTPGRFACGAQRSVEPPEDDEPPRSEKGGGFGFLKAACLVLVCALAALGAGWLGVELHLRTLNGTLYNVQVVHGSASSSSETPSVPGYTGEVLTGTEIYYGLATSQVVGVNTSLSTNAFGQSSENAVSGSGFIFSSDGYILTNYHVVAYAALYDGNLTVLTYDGSSYPARIIGYVEDNDLAVIKIDATDLTPAVMGNSDTMRVGETVYAVGNPLGELTYTMTGGFISALDRVITTKDSITGKANSMNMFQFDAAVNSGNSGGPVYNVYGEVLGIVTAKSGAENVEGLGFAIPINDAVHLATQLIERGYVSGASLGVTVTNTYQAYSSFIQEYYGYPDGACVLEVVPGSAADRGGVQPGDIITALDNRAVSSKDELKLALRHYNPGDTATLTVYRMGKALASGSYVKLTIVFLEQVPEETAASETPAQQAPGNGWWGGFGG